jgi:hypothetical protein
VRTLARFAAVGVLFASILGATPIVDILDLIPIPLAPIANCTVQVYATCGVYHGDEYPTGYFEVDTAAYGPIPFQMGTAGSKNAYSAHVEGINQYVATLDPGVIHTVQVVNLPINVISPRGIFMLLNLFWGIDDSLIARFDFNFQGGGTLTQTFVAGVNVRDYNRGIHTSRLTDTDHVLPDIFLTSSGGQRIDLQVLAIPTEFWGDTLQSVTITDVGDMGVGRTLLFAMTVGSAGVPEPGTVSLIGLGIAVIALHRLRRARA